MRTLTFVVVIATVCLTACHKSSPATKSGDAVQQKLQELSGKDATDCGRLTSQNPDELKKASECAMQASQNKRPFYVAYDMPGLTVAVAGSSDGKLFYVQAQQATEAQGDAKREMNTEPCPSDLRVAQSGRVTCVSPGSMGVGSNPHGGMGMPPGNANPHGGMSMPPAGTANPHGGSSASSKPQASH